LKRAKKIGVENRKLKLAFRSAITTSLVPSFAIVIALLTLAPVLGIPIAWARLSIVGSMLFEITAASVGASSMGVEMLGGPDYTPQVFANSIWAMTIGTTWAILVGMIAMRKVKANINDKIGIDKKWNELVTNGILLAVFGRLIVGPLTKGGLDMSTLLISAGIMGVIMFLVVKYKIKWLREFALPISMLSAMACSVMIFL